LSWQAKALSTSAQHPARAGPDTERQLVCAARTAHRLPRPREWRRQTVDPRRVL
jgi:hypothetical protein